MTSATPKPRAGEHVQGFDPYTGLTLFADGHSVKRSDGSTFAIADTVEAALHIVGLQAERDALRERERELVEFARLVRDWYENAGNADPDRKSPGSSGLWSMAKVLLAKVPNGR